MTFLPYTLMNVSYVVIGSTLASAVHWDRAEAIVLVYLLAVGISAHALDATGPNKPWGKFMSKQQLLGLAVIALVPALGVGAYYAVLDAPWLLVVGGAELFFLFAYNLNLFRSRFHSESWFAFSWGFLPVVAGYVVQTNGIDLAALGGGLFGFVTAFLEASASRPYKLLKREPGGHDGEFSGRFEAVLKCAVGSVLSVALMLVLLRAFG